MVTWNPSEDLNFLSYPHLFGSSGHKRRGVSQNGMRGSSHLRGFQGNTSLRRLPVAEMNMLYLPLLGSKGTGHYWTYFFFPGVLTKWKTVGNMLPSFPDPRFYVCFHSTIAIWGSPFCKQAIWGPVVLVDCERALKERLIPRGMVFDNSHL